MELEIDGSILEGGGQILRISVALSVLTKRPIRISKIRAGRVKGGLGAQHLKGIQLVRSISNAKVEGDYLGSKSVLFKPETISSGEYEADVGTAGSVALLLQVSLPCVIFGKSKSVLTLKGGTNANMAPQIDYTVNVFKPILEKFGVIFECNIMKRGFYPAGNGIIKVYANPVNQLKPLNLVDFGKIKCIRGEAFVAGVLPIKMAEEMALGAKNVLKKVVNAQISITTKKFNENEAFGNGCGINLTAETTTGCYLGGSALGERGINSKEVGYKAAETLLDSLKKEVCVDQHAQDQLIIFMALANGTSRIKTGPITLHTETAMYIAKLFTSANFNIINLENNCNIIECEGQGLV